ncbi:twin-arginine translocase TatA/TatE family subunit [Streptomyces atriruber]|uniref:Twin-arginine translocase TatA/TatE family subunit n=1 Tax=Streptomyces atriruber TaxID=545121 RepID=A0ABV3BWR2_9ACTN
MFGLSESASSLIVVILVFGAKKLAELVRSAGKSARILKAEAKAMKKKEQEKEAADGQAAPVPQVLHGEVIPPHTAANTTPPAAQHAPKPDSGEPHPRN